MPKSIAPEKEKKVPVNALPTNGYGNISCPEKLSNIEGKVSIVFPYYRIQDPSFFTLVTGASITAKFILSLKKSKFSERAANIYMVP